VAPHVVVEMGTVIQMKVVVPALKTAGYALVRVEMGIPIQAKNVMIKIQTESSVLQYMGKHVATAPIPVKISQSQVHTVGTII